MDEQMTPSLFEGDTGTLEEGIRELITFLMAERVFLGRSDPARWDALVEHQQKITSHFHNMYLDLVVDRANRLAFKRQIHPDGAEYRVLLRDQRATRETSIAILYLRDQFNKQTRAGVDRVTITRTDLLADIEAYLPDNEHDLKTRRGNARGAIRSLIGQKLLLGDEADTEWDVSPAVRALFPVEAIDRLTDWLTDPGRSVAELAKDEAVPE